MSVLSTELIEAPFSWRMPATVVLLLLIEKLVEDLLIVAEQFLRAAHGALAVADALGIGFS
jgi:hypothetical protein